MTNYKRFFTSRITLEILVILYCSATNLIKSVSGESNQTSYSVQLEDLPELFSNDKLPVEDEPTNTCFEFLGCIHKFPNGVNPQDPVKMKTRFRIYRKEKETLVPFEITTICLSESSACETYPYNLRLIQESSFDSNLRTIIIIGGYLTVDGEKSFVVIKDLWKELEDANIIIVSWSGGNQGLYQYPVANTKVVSRQISVFLYYLAKLNGYDLNDEEFCMKIMFVGHSLGAHISGFVGQDLGGLVGRIIGLDPAGPAFSDKKPSNKLDKSDAYLVDALHTNGGVFSMFNPGVFGHGFKVGHLDFYANNGLNQPGCITELIGCSHKRALEYYKSILEHELYMRKHLSDLDRPYHNCHRIFAYKSSTYEEFKNGTSLMRNCPLSVLNDDNLFSEDLNDCLVPIDFITGPVELRKELSSKHNFDFNTKSLNNSQFYFYTKNAGPYLNNHQIIKIRIAKTNPNMKKECDIELNFKAASGSKMKHRVEKYQLIEESDHYEVIIPFLALNLESKYQLATLDAHNFFLEEYERLKETVMKIFPISIRIQGLQEGQGKSRKIGFMHMIQNFFGLAQDRYDDEDRHHECSLDVESVIVRPLKKLHRLFIAEYSFDAQKKQFPDIISLFNENSSLPNIEISSSKTRGSNSNTISQNINSEIYIDSVIVGPFNEEMDIVDEGEKIVIDEPERETSSVKPVIWVLMTVLTIAMVILISVFFMKKAAKNLEQDEQNLISTIS